VIRCGDVVRLFDATAAGDAKDRMFVCLDPVNGWFARIVTREPRHYPIRLRAADNDFLDHDSHIETGIPVLFFDDELEEAEAAGQVGRISAEVAKRMLAAWERAEVTPLVVRELVTGQLRETFGL
jgi:hypothetical protein